MGLTVTPQATGPGAGGTRPLSVNGPRDLTLWMGQVTFDDAYPTNGEPFDAEAQSGLRDVVLVEVLPKGGFTFEYVDSATAASRKIKAYWVDTTTDGAAMAEVANDTDTNLADVWVKVWGYR